MGINGSFVRVDFLTSIVWVVVVNLFPTQGPLFLRSNEVMLKGISYICARRKHIWHALLGCRGVLRAQWITYGFELLQCKIYLFFNTHKSWIHLFLYSIYNTYTTLWNIWKYILRKQNIFIFLMFCKKYIVIKVWKI